MATLLRQSLKLFGGPLKPNLFMCCSCQQHMVHIQKQHIHQTAYLSEKKFSDKHEWINVEGGIGTVGISEYAQDKLGDVVYAQLPDEGAEFDKDEECGALESVKAASEIYSPVSGTITAKNAAVEDKPGLINESCYDEGWLFKIELSKADEMSDLMTEDQYKDFLKSQDE